MEYKLDLKDKKILAELEMNARLSHSEIGKRVRLSKQVVKYRIESLEKENIIQGYNCIVDLNKIGLTIYVVYLKLLQLSSSEEFKWTKEIAKNHNVMAVAKNAGYWDMTIVIKCKNNQELDDILKEIISNKSGKIKEKLITSEIESTYFQLNLILKTIQKEFSTSNTQENIDIDNTDKKILSLLGENCLLSLIELSNNLNISPNTVKNRIKNLEKRKIIIGYKTKINYEKLSFLHFRVFLHLTSFSQEIYQKIKTFLKSRGKVESISRYMGYSDIDFRCYSKDIFELYKLISEIKDNFLSNILEVDSMPIFDWERIRYSP